MSWKQYYDMSPFDMTNQTLSKSGASAINDHCFIRKQHKCGKLFGASKSCFIACPTNDDLEPVLGLMSEKLSKLGIEPIIAVKERAYGQDIFCTKICGKIIESRFCIVILDDAIKSNTNIPNPNVYYEYGLMTALRKHIIPLQKDDLELAFNIQSYDTIKYSSKNIGTELDRAIRDAVKITESKDVEKTSQMIADKVILRRMEMSGFDAKDEEWFLSELIDDTAFRGFGNQNNGFYVYMGKIDTDEDIQMYLDDLDIVIYRTEKYVKRMMGNLEKRKIQLEKKKDERQDESRSQPSGRYVTHRMGVTADSIETAIRDIEDKLSLMTTIYIAFIISNEINSTDFLKSAREVISNNLRYKLVFTHEGKMEFDDISVDFATNRH